MKTTLCFFAVILLAAIIGCSDDLNLTDPLNDHNYAGSKQKPNTVNENMELIWQLDELYLKITTEFMVENKAVYKNIPFLLGPNTYLITYDSYTNANKFTNGYGSFVKISRDEDIVYEGSVINGPKKLKLDNVRFNNMVFYISLYQVDNKSRHGESSKDDNNTCVLKLTNLKLHRLN